MTHFGREGHIFSFVLFSRRTTCLKYLVLANMLMKSGINPFDSQETKPYKNDPEILAMTNLVRSANCIRTAGLLRSWEKLSKSFEKY